MITKSIELQKFALTQRVKFVGGEGIVRNFKFEAGNWIYLVEMPLELEPKFGRIGAETMVVLNERELRVA
jgi:hypothetical protein